MDQKLIFLPSEHCLQKTSPFCGRFFYVQAKAGMLPLAYTPPASNAAGFPCKNVKRQ
ncbi:hypothetical protein predicted by Glimmer/Critica [Acetobacter ghanensis]|uniref:Uncharacterized protein n=1 Tax=Acetobacter ghanensis TaxID=431306 RepID=A0A0U5BKP4_9PROT|nr:hypothetical protein predicted by Glimmer/Critica [Acetobacter ghanensis]